MQKNEPRTVTIIGAGFGGLSAGIYAQMNGYRTQIFEMHNIPGGLCTAWKRNGYIIDGCIHWLVGSSSKSSIHRYWEEIGLARGREFINAEEFLRFEGADGRIFILYTNVDRLEKHMLEFSPQDTDAIRQFIRGIRLCLRFEQPLDSHPPLKRILLGIKLGWLLLTRGWEIRKWMNITSEEYAQRVKDPLIRGAMLEWFPQISMFFMLLIFAYLHKQDAGYPIGGSLPMSLALAKRYQELGGVIHYDSRVEKILLEGDTAVGVRLIDGSEHHSERVISAADGYATIYTMLDGKYADAQTHEPYEKWTTFPPLLFVGLGVNRSFTDVPKTVLGMSFPLRQPTQIGHQIHDRLAVHIFNQDHTLAPKGKTTLVLMLPTSYEYWNELAQDRVAYEEKKSQIGRTIIELLEQRFPGISQQVEMVDVASPTTFVDYTGNWKGSFEGWLLTPENISTVLKPMSQVLPGLSNFYMCGQWVQPGGGLPFSVMNARTLIKAICKKDGIKFATTVV